MAVVGGNQDQSCMHEFGRGLAPRMCIRGAGGICNGGAQQAHASEQPHARVLANAAREQAAQVLLPTWISAAQPIPHGAWFAQRNCSASRFLQRASCNAVAQRCGIVANCWQAAVAWMLVLPALSCSVYNVVLAHISPEIAVHPIRRQAMCLQRVRH